MPKPSQPPPSPPKREEDPVWGDLFGFADRPPPTPASRAKTLTPAPSLQPQQPKTPRKPGAKSVPPGRAGNP